MAWKGGWKGGSKGDGPVEFREPVENRVYVGNLSWGVSWRELKDHMKAAGEVAFCDVMTQAATGRSRGCGLVAYRNPEDAQRAVDELHDSELMGRNIFVREDREERVPKAGAARQDCRVYVSNLAWSVTWKDLKDHFRSVGVVSRADVMTVDGYEGSRSRGCGVVEFKTSEEAERAVEELSETMIHDRTIFVREDRESGRPPIQVAAPAWGGGWAGDAWSWQGQGSYFGGSYKGGGGGQYGAGGWSEDHEFTKVFVGNLAYRTTAQELEDHLSSLGKIVHVEIMTTSGGNAGLSKGNAIVEFETFGAARRAVNRMHDSILDGRMILVREYKDEAPGKHGADYDDHDGEDAQSGSGGSGGSDRQGKSGKISGRNCKVLVTGLGADMTWQVLKDFMRTTGDVDHVVIKPTGGLVTFGAASLAKRAVERLSGSKIDGQVVTMKVV